MQHDDVIKWKYFPHYSTFVRWIHRSQVNSPHKGQWRGTLMFSLICALIKPFSKQSWGWWFETPSRSLWRHCNNHVLEMKPPDAYTIRLLTLWGPDKIVVISKTTFSNTFSWMKIYEFRLRFHWSLFLRVQLIIFQYWFRKKHGADQATSHYLSQWWVDYRRIYAPLGLNESNLPRKLNPISLAKPRWISIAVYLNILTFFVK